MKGRFTSENAAQMGRRGGLATVKRHGAAHMAKIGRLGFWATCKRHYGNDPRAMVNTLIARGLSAVDPFPANGAWQGTASNRLPPDWKPKA
jgi:hypothetical protein